MSDDKTPTAQTVTKDVVQAESKVKSWLTGVTHNTASLLLIAIIVLVFNSVYTTWIEPALNQNGVTELQIDDIKSVIDDALELNSKRLLEDISKTFDDFQGSQQDPAADQQDPAADH